MPKIRCFRCKGKGTVKDIDWSVGALMDASDPRRCPACKGKGYLKVKA